MVDTVVIKSEPPVAPEDHDQKMIDLVDGKTPPETPEEPKAEDRPGWLPEKFKTPEDMAKAYAELESKLGKPKEEAPKAEDAPKPAEATPEEATKALSDKGLDINQFSAEWNQNGSLSEESYKKLQDAGYDRNLVDQFIEGQKARATQFESAIKTEVGGEARYNEMVTWAKSNLTPAEIDAYNRAVSSGNKEQASLAAVGLAAKYEKAVGSEPQRTIGGQGKADAGDVFESVAQVTAAMKDPKYKTDPAYRAKVQEKLARSNVM